jgi:energy-coupling factor transport system ATP-binding protein
MYMRLVLKDAEYNYSPENKKNPSAVGPLSFSVAAGEFIALIGHSGSGKSTLAMLMAGLYTPCGGEITFNGAAARKNSVFPGVGVVFQYPEQQLFGETVYEEIAFGLKNFGLPENEIAAAVHASLKEVGLKAELFIERSPFSLSGGEKRRIVLACALALKNEMLIFDEPGAGLDEKGREWIIALAKREHAAGKTVVWITHSMEEAGELAQRILLMRGGLLAMDAAPEEVFAQEELLNEMGLALPLPAVLLRRLKNKGLPLPAKGLSEDEAFAEISALKNGVNYAQG